MNREDIETRKRAIQLETVYLHAPERVWDALTDPQALSHWLLPGTFRPQLGHRFRFTHRTPSGKRKKINCRVVELDAPRRLAYTWRAEDEDAPSLVTWTLEAVEEGTRVCLEHLGPESAQAYRSEEADPLSNCLNTALALNLSKSAGHTLSRCGANQSLTSRRLGKIQLPVAARRIWCVGRRTGVIAKTNSAELAQSELKLLLKR